MCNEEREPTSDTPHAPAARLLFRRRDRVILKRDFAQAFETKCTTSNEWMVVYAAENGRTWSRLGISVSRRVGNAVTRNRFKRRVRDAFRTRRAEIPAGYDFILVAKPPATARSARLVQSVVELTKEAVKKLSRRLRVRKPEPPQTPQPS